MYSVVRDRGATRRDADPTKEAGDGLAGVRDEWAGAGVGARGVGVPVTRPAGTCEPSAKAPSVLPAACQSADAATRGCSLGVAFPQEVRVNLARRRAGG